MSLPPKTLRLRPEIAELEKLTSFMEAFAAENDLPVKDAHALTLAAEELFANTVHHSLPVASFIEVSLARGEIDVVASYSDDGGPFDPTKASAPDTNQPADERAVGGLGLHLIRRTMPLFHYARVGNRNVTTFGKPVSGRSA